MQAFPQLLVFQLFFSVHNTISQLSPFPRADGRGGGSLFFFQISNSCCKRLTAEVGASISGMPDASTSQLAQLAKKRVSPRILTFSSIFFSKYGLKLLDCWKFQLGKPFTVGNSFVNPDVQAAAAAALAESDVDRQMQSQLGK